MPEPKLISNYKSGLNEYYKPWLIPEDAFVKIEDTYILRGSVRSREGYTSIHPTQTDPLAPGPVMGLPTRINPDNKAQTLIGFNRTKAFEFTGAVFSDISGATTWTGSNSNFFQSVNAFRSFFTTNNVDPIRYYYGGLWYDLVPLVNGITILDTAQFILYSQQYLIVLNTLENGVRYGNRARWCKLRNPYATGTPPPTYTLNVDSWREDKAGNGTFVDAETSATISAWGFNKDNIIVFFDDGSTFKLRFTGNAFNPYTWEKVNTEYGSNCPASTVNFDDGCLTIGQRGIILANSNDVQRIDNNIPDFASNIVSTNNGYNRVHGVRNFPKDLVLWSYVDPAQSDKSSPAKVLVYNYSDKAWSKWNLPFTCYGSYTTTSGLTWATATFAWNSPTGQNTTWISGANKAGFNRIIGGSTSGSVYALFSGELDDGQPHGFDLMTKRFMVYGEEGQKTRLDYVDLYFTKQSTGSFTAELYVDEDSTTPISSQEVILNSSGDATYTRVYLNGTGRTIQLRYFATPAQMGSSYFELQAQELWVEKVGRIAP